MGMRYFNKNTIINHPYISDSIDIQYYDLPFRHIVIDNLLNKNIYQLLCDKFPSFISRTTPYKDQPGATSQYEGYISGLSVNDCVNGYDFFIAKELKQFTESAFDIELTQYTAPSAHFHKCPSKNGFIHRDMNICSFNPVNDKDNIITCNCHYTDESNDQQPQSIKLLRSIAFLYYMNNPEDLSNYSGGGTGIYDGYAGKLVKTIEPINNRLFMFEISHNSFHAFIGANFDRSCVVSWFHSSPAYIINRHWNEYYKMHKSNRSLIERWGQNPVGGYWDIEKDPSYTKYFNRPLSEIIR